MTQTRKNILSLFIILTMAFAFIGVMNIEPTYAATKTPAKVTGLKITKDSDSTVKISWKKTKNAKKYQVFRKAGGESRYGKIKTTTAANCTMDQTKGRWYDYKIRAINGKKTGKYSAVKGFRINTKDIYITCDKSSISIGNDPVSIVFDVSYNHIVSTTRDTTAISILDTDTIWEGSNQKYVVKIKALKSGTSELKITVDDQASCSVKVVANVKPSISSETNSVKFTSKNPKTITFTCVGINSVNVSCTSNVKNTGGTFSGSILKLTLTPIKNGTGYVEVSDKSNPNIYCIVPVTVTSLPVPNYSDYAIPDYGIMFDVPVDTTVSGNGCYEYDDDNAVSHANQYVEYLKNKGWKRNYNYGYDYWFTKGDLIITLDWTDYWFRILTWTKDEY